MKNKRIMYALISILFLTIFFGITKVNAEKYTGHAIWPSEHIPNIFIRKYRDDGYIKYQQARFMRRSEDNAFMYCLQPFVDIDNNLPYYNIARSDFASVLNITEEQWDRIALLAYYGYQYNENGFNHSNNKWYAITQLMIWRTIEPQNKFVFTDTLNGKNLPNKFADEIAEMDMLVKNHYTRPNFNITDLSIPLGQSKTLTDSNDVLKYFKVSSTENVNAKIEGNNLILTATEIGKAKVNLVKKATKHSAPPIVYFKDGSQNVMRVGYYDPLPALFNLDVIGGRVEIYKLDSETKESFPQGNASLENAIYGIYTTNNEKIGELTTDSDGYAISDYLPSLGEFYVKEITPSKGYTLDKNKYSFIVDKDNLLANVEVYERVIKADFTLFKTFASGTTGILKGEPNITFNIYLNDCNPRPQLRSIENSINKCFVESIITDENGYAKTSLPYGKYTISQENNTPNYEKVENFEIEVNENTGNNIYKLLSNAPIEAKLKVIKTDKETGEVITKAGIKFKIKDANNSEYICQTITYPTAKKVCEYETDENGVIITPANLVGDFLLEEVENQVLDGYVWNSEAMPIHIGEGSEILVDKDYGALLVVKFANERVKGKLNITKYGEKLIIDNNTFGYEKILLSEVELELYANEDIYIGSKKKYSKDELITTVTTNNGKVVIEDLELEKYYIKEKSTDNNHVLDEKIYTFELKYKDQYTKEIVKDVELQNYYKKGTLEFTKTDLVSGKPIPNTLIEIYSDKELEDGTTESTLIFSGLTDENGQIIIKDLFIGKGHIIEKESATGYQITEEIVEFEIKENGEIVKANLTNEQIVEVPNTMANESKLYTVISITCMVVGMGVFLYVSKKNKKK